MSATPTAALVEEADLDTLADVIKLGAGFADVPHDVARALDESCPHCAYDCMELPTRVEHGNWRCQRRAHVYPVVPQKWLGAIREVREDRQQKRQEAQEHGDYAAALRRAETARDAALKQSAGWEIQAQDLRDRLVKAEAERDAQHERVLRLTAERDEAREGWQQEVIKAIARAQTVCDVVDALDEARAQVWGLICAGSNMAERRRYFRGLWETLLADGLKRDAQLSELTATRDLLLTENAQLQKERDAAIAMEADTARRSSAEIDSLKAELNEARGEVEDLNRRVEEVCGQRDEARERLSEAMRRT